MCPFGLSVRTVLQNTAINKTPEPKLFKDLSITFRNEPYSLMCSTSGHRRRYYSVQDPLYFGKCVYYMRVYCVRPVCE